MESQEHAAVCCDIRSKGAGVIYGEPARWESGRYPTAVFWCLSTAEPVGPDDGFVHPHACVAGRACFCAAREVVDSLDRPDDRP